MNAEEEHGNFRDVLKEALALRATDLHIDPLLEGYELRIRVDGVLQVLRREESRLQEIDGINQIQVDRRHGLGFVEGLRTILRLDTDHVMIGELRRPTAATAAAAAAITGHVVMTSLHTRDAVSAITALRNLGLLDHQIAAALGVVVNQRLVRKLCPKCRTECALTSVQTEWLRAQDIEPPQSVWRPVGCAHCTSTGFLGRTGLFEVWHLDVSDYEMILAGADEESFRDKLRQQHHSTIWDHAIVRIDQGVTCFSEVQRLGLALPWE